MIRPLRTDFFGERRFTARRIATRALSLAHSALLGGYLEVRGRIARASLLGDAPVVVSLTSYGRRIHEVHLVVEAIGRGKERPKRLFLWLDPGVDLSTLPRQLRRAQRRGLTIRTSPHLYGPHTKYFPTTLAMDADPDLAQLDLVTADDDILYARHWLSGLLEIGTDGDRTIICYRAHRIRTQNGVIRPYRDWARVHRTTPSVLNFATGVMGVLYPASFAKRLAEMGPVFMDVCPRADDIWLHATAVREGLSVRQVHSTAIEFPVILGSQSSSLVAQNAFDGGNDVQIANTYAPEDVAILCAAEVAETGTPS